MSSFAASLSTQNRSTAAPSILYVSSVVTHVVVDRPVATLIFSFRANKAKCVRLFNGRITASSVEFA